MDRRRFLGSAGAAAGLVWAAPALTTISAASAQGSSLSHGACTRSAFDIRITGAGAVRGPVLNPTSSVPGDPGCTVGPFDVTGVGSPSPNVFAAAACAEPTETGCGARASIVGEPTSPVVITLAPYGIPLVLSAHSLRSSATDDCASAGNPFTEIVGLSVKLAGASVAIPDPIPVNTSIPLSSLNPLVNGYINLREEQPVGGGVRARAVHIQVALLALGGAPLQSFEIIVAESFAKATDC